MPEQYEQSSQRLLRPADAARYLSLSMSTLAKMRGRGDGPVFLKLGHRIVVYKISDLSEWLETRKRTSTAHHESLEVL